MNNRKLLIILAVLLGIYGISRLFSGNKSATFDSDIVRVDTALVDRIVLNTKGPDSEEITLTKQVGHWQAEAGTRQATSPSTKVNPLLSSVVAIDAMRVISRSPERWPEYEVGEGATRVRMYNGDKALIDLTVGGFKFDQNRRSAASYVRLTDEDEVYIVDGFLSMQFNRDFNAFRNNFVIRTPGGELNRLEVAYGDESTVVEKNLDGNWYKGGMEQLDSTSMASYISGLSNLTGAKYADDFLGNDAATVKELRLIGNNMLTPIAVRFYANKDSTYQFIANSTTNEETYFLVDSLLYQRIIGKLETALEAL